jgi:transcriptional regulator with XRE-family HTH domain
VHLTPPLEIFADLRALAARLGERVRKLRKAAGFSQEDMISFGFSARHWQQIEAGRPITVTTLLRICETFRVPVAGLLQGLDKGIYRREEKPKTLR